MVHFHFRTGHLKFIMATLSARMQGNQERKETCFLLSDLNFSLVSELGTFPQSVSTPASLLSSFFLFFLLLGFLYLFPILLTLLNYPEQEQKNASILYENLKKQTENYLHKDRSKNLPKPSSLLNKCSKSKAAVILRLEMLLQVQKPSRAPVAQLNLPIASFAQYEQQLTTKKSSHWPHIPPLLS